MSMSSSGSAALTGSSFFAGAAALAGAAYAGALADAPELMNFSAWGNLYPPPIPAQARFLNAFRMR